MTIVRAHFVNTDPEYADSHNYLFDLVLDADGKPVKTMCFFGLWGELNNSANRFPALLMLEEKIDMGTDFGPNRFQETNIRDRKIAVGELVTIWEADPDQPATIYERTLRIDRVTPLS